MAKDQLLTYITTQLASGFSKESISQTLEASGYTQAEILEAFALVSSSPPTPVLSPSVEQTHAELSPPTQTFYPPSQPSTANGGTTLFSEDIKSHPTPSRFAGKKKYLFVLLPIILLIFIGFAVFFYITNSPRYVLGKAFEKTKTITSLSYDGSLKASFTFSFPSLSSFNASPSSQIGYSDDFTKEAVPQTTDKKNAFVVTVKMKGSSDFTAKTKHSYTGEISIGDGDLNSLGGAVELRLLGDTTYLRIAKFPNFGLFDTASLTNQWIKLDEKDLKASYLSHSVETKPKKALTSEEIQKLQEMAKKAELFSVAKTLPSESIEGQSSHHYEILINKKNLETFFSDAAIFLAKNEDEARLFKDLKGYIAKVTVKKSEIWISKKEKYVTRILLDIQGNKTEYGDISIATDIKMKDINKPVSIIAPIDAKTWKDLYPSSFDTYSDLATESATLSPTNTTPTPIQSGPTPIIVPYGTVLGDKTKKKKQQLEDIQKPLTPGEQLMSLFLKQLLSSKNSGLH